MAERQYRTLTKRTVDRLSVNGKDAVFWDNELPGFGVRVYPSGKKVFVVQTRAFGRSKRVSLGTHGDTDFSVDHARRKATDIIARIKAGEPPVAPEPAPDPTVADLAERYEREYVAMHCKPATISHYRLMLRKHIVPALGERRVSDVEYKDILAFHNSLHHMPTVANRAADILVKMFNLSDAWGWRPSGANPCRGVSRFRVEKHERFLTREELYRLGETLRAAPEKRLASTHAAAAIRLLVLTGCRRNEILGLRWDDLNFDTGEMRLPDTKTGTRMVPLTPAVARVFDGLSRTPGNPWVFPGKKNRTVLSQCNNVIAMRLTNGDDQGVIKRLLPDSLGSFGDLLPVLDVGEALVVGDASLLPTRIRIAGPSMKPDSQTVAFWDRWNDKTPKSDTENATRSWRRQNLN